MSDHALSAQHSSDWRYWFGEQRGTLLAFAVFVIMFVIYTSNHQAGFSANVVTTAANKGVLLALIAIAQTFVVLTSGIDLSIGMIFILCNCVASYIVVGTALEATLGVFGVLLTGLACGALNGLIVIYGRLQPIVTTIATGAAFFGIALLLRPFPGGEVHEGLADFLTGQLPGGIPASAVALLVVVLVIWIPFRKSMLGRVVYAVGSAEPAAYMSGLHIQRAKFAAYALAGLLAAIGGLFITFVTYTGEASSANANTYTLNSIAAVVLGGVSLFGGRGSAIGAIFGALIYRTIGDLLFVFDLDALWQPLFLGVVLLVSVCLGSFRLFRIRNRLDLFDKAMTNLSASNPVLRRFDPAVLTAFGCIVALLLIGSIVNENFLSPEYLLQQLQVGSFLALVSTGMMIVILLGQIDLSVPWIITVGGMMSTAAAGWGPWGATFAIPVGILCGLAFGLVNGVGVAYLRVPSMIFTLAINAVALGLMTVRTGGFAPQDMATEAMNELATGRLIFGIPNPVWVWIVVGGATVFLLRRTVFGRAVYAIGNREIAAYLSGIRTQRVVLAAFAISGALSAFAGALLAGYSTKAYQGMGDPYLLPSIAAVVLGGTSILGGRGTYLGTVAGIILITLLQSILSVVQIEEAFRQLIYGAVIITMLLIYGRQRVQT